MACCVLFQLHWHKSAQNSVAPENFILEVFILKNTHQVRRNVETQHWVYFLRVMFDVVVAASSNDSVANNYVDLHVLLCLFALEVFASTRVVWCGGVLVMLNGVGVSTTRAQHEFHIICKMTGRRSMRCHWTLLVVLGHILGPLVICQSSCGLLWKGHFSTIFLSFYHIPGRPWISAHYWGKWFCWLSPISCLTPWKIGAGVVFLHRDLTDGSQQQIWAKAHQKIYVCPIVSAVSCWALETDRLS